MTRHPEPAGKIGGTTYWYEDEWADWYEAHQHGQREGLTQVDREGDPDDLVDAAEAARIMGYSGRAVIHGNVRLGYFPQPDSRTPAPRGRPQPLWRRSTVWAAADSRTRSRGGAPPGTPGAPTKPHPYAGDPRLEAALRLLGSGTTPSTAELAEQWGVSQRTAERIVRAARDQFLNG